MIIILSMDTLRIEQQGQLVIAIEGCMHGCLDQVYQQVAILEARRGVRVDLLVNCGDFEAIRSEKDLPYMKVPEKYRHTGDFPGYYSGQKKVPYLTVFIGGNHEASNYLKTLPFGGYVCPGVYFMGNSGVLLLEKMGR